MREANGQALAAAIAVCVLAAPVAAADPPLSSRLPIVDTIRFDNLDEELWMPRGGESVPGGAGEAIDLFAGNLRLTSNDVSGLPIGGGTGIGFARTYNLKNARLEHVRYPNDGQTQVFQDRLYGRSWAGFGWTAHLGRIFRSSRYKEFPDGRFKYDDVNTERDFYEFPTGDLYRFFPYVKLAYPSLLIEYLKDCGGVVEPPEPPACCYRDPANKPWCDENSPKCNPVDSCENRYNKPAQYRVTDPDGTVYILEQLVAAERVGAGYINNADRAGWYVVEIRDRHGNTVRVQYWNRFCKANHEANCDARYPFPEAIKSIGREDAQGQLLEPNVTFTVWQASDNVAPEIIGMLKELSASATGSQRVKYQFTYSLKPVTAAAQAESWTVPVLDTVSQFNGGSLLASTSFSYGPTVGDVDTRYAAVLGSVQYSTGAVSQFGYAWWDAALQEPGATVRRAFGTSMLAVNPDGVGTVESPKPRASWLWSRSPNLSGSCSSTTPWYLGGFTLTQPDGRSAVTEYYGHPCGLSADWGPAASPRTTRLYSGAGQKPIRSIDNVYDYSRDPDTGEPVRVIQQRQVVIYHDDLGGAFDTPESIWCETSCQQMTTSREIRDTWGRWKATTISGSYLPKKRRLYTEFETLWVGSRCYGNHVLGPWTHRVVQDEGGDRIQENATFAADCDNRLSSLTSVAQTLQYVDAAAPTAVTPSATDPTRHWDHDSGDNLLREWTTGAETYPDGASQTARGETQYTTSNGLVTQAMLRDVRQGDLWKGVDRTLAPNGLPLSTKDPNGLETRYLYDGANRPISIDPPGDSETATTITYPDVRTVVATSGAGAAELHAERIADGLGRLVEERRVLPSGSVERRVRRYDQFGRVVFVSEWHIASAILLAWQSGSYTIKDVPATSEGNPLGTTLYFGILSTTDPLNPLAAAPDPLGRVRHIRRADGSTTDVSYRGPHQRTAVHGVRTSLAGTTSDAETTRYFDGLGRLVIVDAPPGTANAVYAYNARDQLTVSRLLTDTELTSDPFGKWKSSEGFPAGQPRTFQYL